QKAPRHDWTESGGVASNLHGDILTGTCPVLDLRLVWAVGQNEEVRILDAGSEGRSACLQVRLARAGEDAGQGVVILRRDRIELVIVTASAGDRQAEKRAAERVNTLLPLLRDYRLDDIRSELQLLPVARTQANETERGAVVRL